MTLALDHYAYSLFAADAYRDPQDPPEKQDNYAPPPVAGICGLWGGFQCCRSDFAAPADAVSR